MRGKEFATQADLDHALIALDGSANKSNLGANAILAVSIAFARAAAVERREPLFAYFASLIGQEAGDIAACLTINLFSGGKHAGGQVAIQDVADRATGGRGTIDESLAAAYAIYQSAARLCHAKYASPAAGGR